MKKKIKVYCRIKPADVQKEIVESAINVESDAESLILIRNTNEDHFLNGPETHIFRFQKVFGQTTKQEDIFDVIAKPVVDRFIRGYNGTLFAYGQTGSGKTFTISGGPDKYEDRGVVPRTIEYIFQTTEQIVDTIYTITISYVEIYNEVGYDLINPRSEASKLGDLPHLLLLEDESGNVHLRNLSLHTVTSADEALHLLFLGDTNKMIAETPMNPCSSRSHSVFTIHLMSHKAESITFQHAKLHLVDLAGSERVHKSRTDGCRLVEARSINLSLHYLEGVIAALSEPGRVHIPYRNSILTSLLRDSLGGNCYTCMVATLSVQLDNFQETLSTCRFAQRVALVGNEAQLNVERDPRQENLYLQAQISELKAQLAVLSSQQLTEKLTSEEQAECKKLVEHCLKDEDYDPPPDLRKIRTCFALFKMAVDQAHKEQLADSDMWNVAPPADIDRTSLLPTTKQSSDEKMENISKNVLLQQRDNEIAILTHLLRKECLSADRTHSPPLGIPKELQNIVDKTNTPLSVAEQEGLSVFLGNMHHREELDHLKQELRAKYNEAKQHGTMIEENRSKMEKLKQLLDQANSLEHHEQLKLQLKKGHHSYQQNLQALQDLRTETEHLRHSANLAAVRLLHRFRNWWATQLTQDVGINNCTGLTEERERQSLSECTAHPNVKRDNYRLPILQKMCIPEVSSNTDPCKLHVICQDMDQIQLKSPPMQRIVTTTKENTNHYGFSIPSVNTDKYQHKLSVSKNKTVLSQEINYDNMPSNLHHKPISSQSTIDGDQYKTVSLQTSLQDINGHQQGSSLSQQVFMISQENDDNQYTVSLLDNVPGSQDTDRNKSFICQKMAAFPLESIKDKHNLYGSTQKSCCSSTDVAVQPEHSSAVRHDLIEEVDPCIWQSLPLTGDQDIDDEIVKFYTAKNKVYLNKLIKCSEVSSS